jgi:hypothetical protein
MRKCTDKAFPWLEHPPKKILWKVRGWTSNTFNVSRVAERGNFWEWSAWGILITEPRDNRKKFCSAFELKTPPRTQGLICRDTNCNLIAINSFNSLYPPLLNLACLRIFKAQTRIHRFAQLNMIMGLCDPSHTGFKTFRFPTDTTLSIATSHSYIFMHTRSFLKNED